MFLEDLLCDVKILTVQKLEWSKTDADVSPRKFSALSLRMKGNATLCASKEMVRPQTGDILFVPENLGYYVKSDAEEIYVIHFKSNSEFDKKIELFSNTDFSKVSRLFSLCYEIWNKKEQGYYFKTLSVFYNIIEILSKSSAKELYDETYLKIKPAIDYLKTHFNKHDLSVLTLANIVNMSDTYFRKLFFEIYHTTPKIYINGMRISYAKELIESKYYSLSQVSELAGFCDTKYFYTVFKKYADMKPTAFKNSVNKG